jgi:hypothetical protein
MKLEYSSFISEFLGAMSVHLQSVSSFVVNATRDLATRIDPIRTMVRRRRLSIEVRVGSTPGRCIASHHLLPSLEVGMVCDRLYSPNAVSQCSGHPAGATVNGLS